MNQACPGCGEMMVPASVRGGGRIGWFCWECEAFVPDGNYITVYDTDGSPW